jgi:BON domain
MAIRGILYSMGFGAGLMYFLDPVLGRRRQAIARDKLTHWTHRTQHTWEAVERDVSHRIEGLKAEFRTWTKPERPEQIPDGRLEARVRTVLGRHCTHPGAVEVHAHQGHVTLKGPVLAEDVEEVVSTVRRVRGVLDIDNKMDVREQPGDIPGLQGPGYHGSERVPSDWSPATRLAAGTLGTLLMARCARNPTPLNVILGTLGFGLFVRGVTNMEMMRVQGIGQSREAAPSGTLAGEASPAQPSPRMGSSPPGPIPAAVPESTCG